MPRLDYVTCSCCGGHRDNVGPISHSRLCGTCAAALLTENIVGIATKSGPAHRRRLRGIARYLAVAMNEETA